MRRHAVLPTLIFLCSLTPGILHAASGQAARDQAAIKAKAQAAYGKLPLTFVENHGQLDKRVKYVINGPRATAFFTDDGLTLDMWEAASAHVKEKGVPKLPAKPQQPKIRKRAVLKMFFAGANHGSVPTGIDKLPGGVNYMVGNDQSKWHTGIPTFKRIIYKNLWPGVDLVYQGDGGKLKYDIRVSPKADLSAVRLR